VKAARSVRVAAVQVRSDSGQVDANLAHAQTYVAEAARRGAELVVCPEFLAAGYVYDASIWRSGEPRGGPTETWLRRLAKHHGIHIGASYLEADGDDFFNTFTLATPDGGVAGRVRKESLPAFEGWFFKSCTQPKVIDTALGRIAVGICQDNHTARFFRRVIADDPDLIVMPHSAPCVPIGGPLVRQGLAEIGPHYASAFGIPVVVVNKARTTCRSPIPGLPGLGLRFDFRGLSTITDSDGAVLEQLRNREGVVSAEVHLDPSRKRKPDPPATFYWSRPPRVLPRTLGAMFVVLEELGKIAYARSPRRRRAARLVQPPAACVNATSSLRISDTARPVASPTDSPGATSFRTSK
jgi:N-carbamoylputrescine amidase